MKPCNHDNRVHLHQTSDAYVVWCTMCGASAISVSDDKYNWRLPDREKWNLCWDNAAHTSEETPPQKPIKLELQPSELWLLAKWAFKYLGADDPPLPVNEALLATHLIEAHARYLTAALRGKQ